MRNNLWHMAVPALDDKAHAAQVRLKQRRCAARCRADPHRQAPLWCTVLDGLRCHRSPQQIAGKLPGMKKSAILSAQSLQAAPPSRDRQLPFLA